jgi:hypothetical protein
MLLLERTTEELIKHEFLWYGGYKNEFLQNCKKLVKNHLTIPVTCGIIPMSPKQAGKTSGK